MNHTPDKHTGSTAATSNGWRTGILDKYRELFGPLADTSIRLLQIGIDDGSVQNWDFLFRHPTAQILAIDSALSAVSTSQRVRFRRLDRNDLQGLSQLATEFGPFDIILDHSSHAAEDATNVFNVLYRHLTAGGYYGIKDWHGGPWTYENPHFEGVLDVVTSIGRRAHELRIADFRINAEPVALAIFQKARDGHGQRDTSSTAPRYSVAIPVFNSERTIAEVVERTITVLREGNLNYEVILVNDGSKDGSWDAIKKLSQVHPCVTAVDLLKNYGQYNALFCAFRMATGDYVITLDDDLQNPPEEIPKFIHKGREGYDLVIGMFQKKQHSRYRRWGSKFVNYLYHWIFDKPLDLVVSNYLMLHRSVIDRFRDFRGPDIHLQGLAIANSRRATNITVEHAPRFEGKSNYGFREIVHLVITLLFNYSIYPLRFFVFLGLGVSVASFTLAGYFLVSRLYGNISVPGWASIGTMIPFFSGFIILLIGIFGEYIIRIIKVLNYPATYQIHDVSKGK
jgi:glycosyltransferase involved in cell wall biosynthesis